MWWKVSTALALICGILLGLNYTRPVPPAVPTMRLPVEVRVAGATPALPWPGVGAAAVGVSGLGALATSGDVQPGPAASVTKVMTALVVLKDHPLNPGEEGPGITLTGVDEDAYHSDRAQGQSVVAVRAGEVITEFQAMEAMLIPSGNNIAETLARWDAESVAAFVDKMNLQARTMGLMKTRFADPAGADGGSTSTPGDLMALGMAAMRLPVFAQIVALPSAVLPVAGAVYNVDAALGKDGIVGIKTGSGFNVGANFLFAASVKVDSHLVTIFGCVMGQPTLAAAFDASRALVRAMIPILSVKQVLARNQSVGSYSTPWGDQTDVVSTVDVLMVEWPQMVMRNRLDAPVIRVDRPLNPGADAGRLHVVLGDYNLDVPVVTASGLYPPGKLWRLTRLPGNGT